jgi:hypothetical protein
VQPLQRQEGTQLHGPLQLAHLHIHQLHVRNASGQALVRTQRRQQARLRMQRSLLQLLQHCGKRLQRQLLS